MDPLHTGLCSGEPTVYLDWKQRPPALEHKIAKAFQKLIAQEKSNWGRFNGASEYSLCGIEDYDLVKKVMSNAISHKKEVALMDIGAGDFRWGHFVFRYILRNIDRGNIVVPPDFKVHIISIRGETNHADVMTREGICTHYQLGGICVEELESDEQETHLKTQLRKLGLELRARSVDLIVSKWCFRHLADPVGTFAQAYNLLQPKTGLFLLDGFFFNTDEGYCEDQNVNMVRLLTATGSPFVMRKYNLDCSLNQFCLRRVDDRDCQLKLQYKTAAKASPSRYQIGSKCITYFQGRLGEVEISEIIGSASGDRDLHHWLVTHELFMDKDMVRVRTR